MAEAAKKTNPAQQTQEQQIAADIPPSKPGAAAEIIPAPKPHKDLQRATSTIIDGLDDIFVDERLDCMLGDINNKFKNFAEDNKKYIASNKGKLDSTSLIPTPPVGEYCLTLLKYSATVENDPKLYEKSFKRSLIPPYLSLLGGQDIVQTKENALNIIASYDAHLSKPSTRDKIVNEKSGIEFSTLPKKIFPQTTATAFDVTFVGEIMKATQNKKIPVRPANSKALYDTTQACFAGNTETLGACVKAAKDQAAIYLNDTAATSNVNLPKKPTPAKSSALN